MTYDVCAFTAVCLEDAGWILQYLTEAERLGPVTWRGTASDETRR